MAASGTSCVLGRHRDFDEHEPDGHCADVEGPLHHTGSHIRLPQDFTHGDGLIGARRGKVRTHRVLVDGRASRQIEDGHVISERLRQPPMQFSEPRPA